MLQLLYILVFAVLAFLAVGNLIRNLINLGLEAQRQPPASLAARPKLKVSHPELLDASGQLVDEPLLVMRSMPLDEVRDKLDALYNSSPGPKSSDSDE